MDTISKIVEAMVAGDSATAANLFNRECNGKSLNREVFRAQIGRRVAEEHGLPKVDKIMTILSVGLNAVGDGSHR